jgi:hypothetical protein
MRPSAAEQYGASGHDNPLGDQAGAPKRWTPEEIKKVSEDEVRTPADGPDVEPPDDREAEADE